MLRCSSSELRIEEIDMKRVLFGLLVVLLAFSFGCDQPSSADTSTYNSASNYSTPTERKSLSEEDKMKIAEDAAVMELWEYLCDREEKYPYFRYNLDATRYEVTNIKMVNGNYRVYGRIVFYDNFGSPDYEECSVEVDIDYDGDYTAWVSYMSVE